jgi:hypothetical protein
MESHQSAEDRGGIFSVNFPPTRHQSILVDLFLSC